MWKIQKKTIEDAIIGTIVLSFFYSVYWLIDHYHLEDILIPYTAIIIYGRVKYVLAYYRHIDGDAFPEKKMIFKKAMRKYLLVGFGLSLIPMIVIFLYSICSLYSSICNLRHDYIPGFGYMAGTVFFFFYLADSYYMKSLLPKPVNIQKIMTKEQFDKMMLEAREARKRGVPWEAPWNQLSKK